MFVVTKGWIATNPRAWPRVAGAIVLPSMVLAGVGPGVNHAGRFNPEVVQVVIHGNRLEIPGSLTAGDLVFEVTNRDSVTHGFALRKEGADTPLAQLEVPVRAGATGRVEASLDPGRYRVYCPNGVDRGLVRTVSVAPPSSKPAN